MPLTDHQCKLNYTETNQQKVYLKVAVVSV